MQLVILQHFRYDFDKKSQLKHLIIEYYFNKVCFLPLMLVNVADDDVTYPYLHIIASILAWASAIINPFIYAFKNRQYQQAFVKVKCFQIDIMIGIDIYNM